MALLVARASAGACFGFIGAGATEGIAVGFGATSFGLAVFLGVTAGGTIVGGILTFEVDASPLGATRCDVALGVVAAT